MPITVTVEHQSERRRFVILTEQGEAELTYHVRGNLIVFDHTGVPEAMQHQGLANRLAEAGLAYARANGLKVEPRCRFMAVYVMRHREHSDLLA